MTLTIPASFPAHSKVLSNPHPTYGLITPLCIVLLWVRVKAVPVISVAAFVKVALKVRYLPRALAGTV